MSEALLIFVKNLIPGQVKTRLAATIGNTVAMHIYKELLQHTHTITRKVHADKMVFYSHYIDEGDIWNRPDFKKNIQLGKDLGERMQHAFILAFEKRYDKAVIIGTDCPGIEEKIINEAFTGLNNFDIVIGPASDGGYYLLGMKNLCGKLFEEIDWSTQVVLKQTIQKCRQHNLSYYLLPVLADVDEEKDLIEVKWKIK